MSEPRTRTKYTYDALGRLSTAGTVGSTGYAAWGLSWTYDRYGNRTAQTVTAGSGLSDSLVVSTSTNRVTGTGYSYDAAGNMTGDAVNTMTYDAARRLISSSNSTSSGAYAYDGKGMRVKKCVPNCSSPTTTTVYIFAGGKVLDEYDNGAAYNSPSREYIYSGGAQIAKIIGTTTTYYHQDHLSNRLVTSSTGSVVEQMGHTPYGDAWYDTGSEKWAFTTYERDAESGNDYAQARYDVSRLGRFASPDPLSGSVANPQSLNHYVYAGNDPINAVDPTGADFIAVGDGPDSCGDAHVEDITCEARGTFGCSMDYGCGGGGAGGGSEGGGGGEGGNPSDPSSQIADAQAAAAYIIATDPSCGAYFGSAYMDSAMSENDGGADAVAPIAASDAAAGLANESIAAVNLRRPTISYNDGAHTATSDRLDAGVTRSGNIVINTNGAFFPGEWGAATGVVDLSQPPRPPDVGFSISGSGYSFGAGSIGMQVETILHEYAHQLGINQPDLNDPTKSQANISDVLANCGAAINGLSGQSQ